MTLAILRKTPCGWGWAGGVRPGPLGPSQREGRGKKEVGCGPGGEKRVSPLFFWFSFLSLFKFKFQLSFEFCLNSNFAKKILNTHGLLINNHAMLPNLKT
jgi:hypothetical protein